MPLNDKVLLEAIEEAKKKATKRNFTQTVELIINLKDVDTKKPENRFQESIELPHKVKDKKICVIASGDVALRARRAGADLVMDRKELEALSNNRRKIKEISKNYDYFIAEGPLMPLVGRYMGFTLGPRGKMPTPIPSNADVAEVIEKHRRMVTLRLRGAPVLRCGVGRENMDSKEILENIKDVIERIQGRLRRGIKNIDTIYIKTTMGKPVKIKV